MRRRKTVWSSFHKRCNNGESDAISFQNAVFSVHSISLHAATMHYPIEDFCMTEKEPCHCNATTSKLNHIATELQRTTIYPFNDLNNQTTKHGWYYERQKSEIKHDAGAGAEVKNGRVYNTIIRTFFCHFRT